MKEILSFFLAFLTATSSPIASMTLPVRVNPAIAHDKVRVLIVPGHEPVSGEGARFGSIEERNLVVEIGQDLERFLNADPDYQAFITRDLDSWNPAFADYFKDNWGDISSWQKASKKSASEALPIGSSSTVTVIHNPAPNDVALRLYGITKWSNENDIDLMLHLHLNDYPGHGRKTPGKYSGFVMYSPALQYGNSSSTDAVAHAIYERLAAYNPKSNLPVESKGIIDDPELIAVGAHNTSKAASLVIEYEYLYRPQLTSPDVRSLALKDFAYQTYLGLKDAFAEGASSTRLSYDPSILYDWSTPVVGAASDSRDIYALQTALIMAGEYPPKGRTGNDCPHSGSLGPCTSSALAAFQKKQGIAGEGIGGAMTFEALKAVYDGK